MADVMPVGLLFSLLSPMTVALTETPLSSGSVNSVQTVFKLQVGETDLAVVSSLLWVESIEVLLSHKVSW